MGDMRAVSQIFWHVKKSDVNGQVPLTHVTTLKELETYIL
jgi:hypothetical protein